MNVFNLSFVDFKKEIELLAVPFLFLFFLAVLVPINGLGSTGLILIMMWLLWRDQELRNRWWTATWPWFLAVFIYFSILFNIFFACSLLGKFATFEFFNF